MGSANDRRWLILVIGLPGSGKTTICAALRASIPDSVEWDFDDAMPEAFKAKMRNGQVITEDERDNLITHMIQGWKQRLAVSAAVMSACMLVRERHRARILAEFSNSPYGVVLLSMDAPVDVLAARLQRRSDEHFCKSEAVLRKLAAQNEAIGVPHTAIDATLPHDQCLSLAMEAVRSHMQSAQRHL